MTQARRSLFGSFNSYKYNGKELQETRMFDYGWRQYIPDLGRWNGMDQLAESYLSTSPYAYVANNPVSLTDPDEGGLTRMVLLILPEELLHLLQVGNIISHF